jgi:hypothetical protein
MKWWRCRGRNAAGQGFGKSTSQTQSALRLERKEQGAIAAPNEK